MIEQVAPPLRDAVIVQKRKYDGSLKSSWEGEQLASPHEAWRVVLHDPRRHTKVAEGGGVPYATLFLHFCCTTQPLTVLSEYGADGRFRGAKCDAALPAVQEANVLSFVDLDLDFLIAADLSTRIQDWDDLARRTVSMGYPPAIIEQAYAGVVLAEHLFAARNFPFDPSCVPQLAPAFWTPPGAAQNIR